MTLFYISLAVEYIEEYISSRLDWLISWLTTPDALALKDQLASMHTRRASAHSTSRQTQRSLKEIDSGDVRSSQLLPLPTREEEAAEEEKKAIASTEYFIPGERPTSRIINGRFVNPEAESSGFFQGHYLGGFIDDYSYDLFSMRRLMQVDITYDFYAENNDRVRLIRIIHLCDLDYLDLPNLIQNKKIELHARLKSLIHEKSFPTQLDSFRKIRNVMILLEYLEKLSAELKPILDVYHQHMAQSSVLAAAPEQTLAHRAGQAPASGINRLHSVPETGEEEDSDSDDAASPDKKATSDDKDSPDKKLDPPQPTVKDVELASLYHLYHRGLRTETPAPTPIASSSLPAAEPETEVDDSSENSGPEESCSDDDDKAAEWLSDEEVAKVIEDKWNLGYPTLVHTTDSVDTELTPDPAPVPDPVPVLLEEAVVTHPTNGIFGLNIPDDE